MNQKGTRMFNATIQGYSDDLIHVEGDGLNEEYGHFSDHPIYLNLSDGSVLKCQHAPEGWGAWKIEPHKIAEGTEAKTVEYLYQDEPDSRAQRVELVTAEPIRWARLWRDPDGPDQEMMLDTVDDLDAWTTQRSVWSTTPSPRKADHTRSRDRRGLKGDEDGEARTCRDRRLRPGGQLDHPTGPPRDRRAARRQADRHRSGDPGDGADAGDAAEVPAERAANRRRGLTRLLIAPGRHNGAGRGFLGDEHRRP